MGRADAVLSSGTLGDMDVDEELHGRTCRVSQMKVPHRITREI